MKGSTGAALLVYLSAAVMPRMAAADAGWYGSADIGQAYYEGLFPYSTVQPRDKNGAYRIAVGYQITPYVSVEAGYLGVGAARLTANVKNCYIGLMPGCANSYMGYSSVKTSGLVAEATGTLPAGQDWSLFGRAGWYRDHTVETGYSVPAGIGARYDLSSMRTAFTYGVGVEWAYSQHFTFRLAWDKYLNLGDATSTGQQYSLGVLMFGLAYSIQ